MVGRYITLLVILAASVDAASVATQADCDLCKGLVVEQKIIWTDKDTQELVQIAKKLICANVPIEDCDNWMTARLAALSDLIAGLDPDEFCSALKVCTTRNDISWLRNDQHLESGMTCKVCEFVGERIKAKVFSERTIDEVLEFTEEVCAELPLFLGNECTALVKEYGHYYLQLLAGTINVEQLCEKAGLCSADLQHMLEAMEIFQVVAQGLKEGEGCRACVDGMTIVQTVLTSKDTAELIDLAVKDVCDLTGFDECELIAKMIVKKMMKKLVAMFNPEAACKKMGACSASLMEEQSVPTVTVECQICTDALDEVKKVANDKETPKIVEDLGKVLCEKLDIPFCTSIIPKLLMSQLEKLKALDVAATCVKLGACTSSTPFDAYLEKEASLGDTCSECTIVVNTLISALENEQIDSLVKEAIGEICTILPISDCAKTLDGYFDELVALLKNFDGKTLCGLIGLCSSRTEIPVPFVALGDTCSECAMVADELISTLESEEVESMIKETISEVCSVLPISDCEKTLDGYFDELIALLKTMDGKSLCGLIGFCSSPPETPVPVNSLGDTCSECTIVVNTLISALENEQIDSLVKEAIEEICTILPISDCAKTLDGYFDELVALLKNFDGKTVCGLIGLCSSRTETPVPFVALGDTCSECAMVADELISTLESEEVESMIKETISEVCSVLPISDCEKTLDGYFDELMELLKAIDGKTLCELFGLCSSTIEIPMPTEVGESCDECAQMAEFFLVMVRDPANHEFVQEFVDSICYGIPEIPYCNKTVWDLIETMDGKTACAILGICDFDESFYSIGDTCSECTSIVSAVKAALDKEAMDGLVKDMIGEVCSVLPTVPHCTEILGGYFSDFEVFLKSKDEETICGMIGRCADPEPEPVIPVGTLEDSCPECEEVANLLLAELKNPSYQELVEDNLRLVCKVLPIPNCTATVHEYMQLVEKAVDSMDGKTLCNYIGFC